MMNESLIGGAEFKFGICHEPFVLLMAVRLTALDGYTCAVDCTVQKSLRGFDGTATGAVHPMPYNCIDGRRCPALSRTGLVIKLEA